MTKSETIKEINKELQSLHLRVAACDKVLKELLTKGLHLTERYKMNEAAKYKYLTMAAELKQWLKGLKNVQQSK
jgi:hypothetical protein